MSRRLLAAFSLIAITTASASARADTDDLTNAGVVIGLERVVSLVTWESVSTSLNGTSSTAQVASFASFGPDPGGVGDAFAVAPRLAVDGVVGHGFTLGAAAWIFTDVSSSNTTSGGGASQSNDGTKRTFGGIAPRLGYILPLTPNLAFWPRAGVAYSTISTSSPSGGSGVVVSSGGSSLNQFSVDLEGNLVYSPFPHVGFDLDLLGSIPASGNLTAAGSSQSLSIAEAVVALTGGIMGWF
jgi:hypothetical protein